MFSKTYNDMRDLAYQQLYTIFQLKGFALDDNNLVFSGISMVVPLQMTSKSQYKVKRPHRATLFSNDKI